MSSQPDNRRPPPPLASIEADLFGTLLAFHAKTMTLLRESPLDDEKRKMVADRIMTLLEDATAEMREATQLKIKERLEAAYEEAKRLVDELSSLPGQNDE